MSKLHIFDPDARLLYKLGAIAQSLWTNWNTIHSMRMESEQDGDQIRVKLVGYTTKITDKDMQAFMDDTEVVAVGEE